MQAKLDESLLPSGRLTFDQCVAINVFWRKGVSIPVLRKVFKVGRNQIYYRAVGGDGSTYPPNATALKVNALVNEIGVDAAWRKFVTEDMVKAVNAQNAIEAKSRPNGRVNGRPRTYAA